MYKKHWTYLLFLDFWLFVWSAERVTGYHNSLIISQIKTSVHCETHHLLKQPSSFPLVPQSCHNQCHQIFSKLHHYQDSCLVESEAKQKTKYIS